MTFCQRQQGCPATNKDDLAPSLISKSVDSWVSLNIVEAIEAAEALEATETTEALLLTLRSGAHPSYVTMI